MKLYLVRHGRTAYNELSLHQHGDTNLSELGLKQAEILAKRFSKIPVDIIYASPLKRAKDTAEIIDKTLEKKIIYSDFLREKKNPSEIVGKKTDSDEVQEIHKSINLNSNDPLWHYSDEENFIEFKTRVLQFFKVLNKEKRENILVVTHGGPIRMIVLSMIFGNSIPAEIFLKFKFSFGLNNTGITLCEKDKNEHWVVKTFNDHSHLG